MSAILDVIDKIRECPAIMLGSPSARTLYAFLSGFAFARKASDPPDYDFLNRFNQWVHDRYQVSSVQGWAKIIAFHSATEADEMTLFWKLVDEFVAAKPDTRQRKLAKHTA